MTYPWTAGPWFTNGFRTVSASVAPDSRMRSWPDCTGEYGDGRYDCDEKECSCRAICKDEWDDYRPLASIAHIPNVIWSSQGDQVISHPEVAANVDLIALAPEMAEAILAWTSAESCGFTKPECKEHCKCLAPADKTMHLVADRLREIIEKHK